MIADVPRETFSREIFAARFDVSRETMAKLDVYLAMLVEWQSQMNLVGPATLDVAWHRHIADSAQLTTLGRGTWVDLGSGAGFPGIIVALLGGGPVTLIEATAKKAAFLRAVVAATGVLAEVVNARIESLTPTPFETITARACASLAQIFEWGQRFAAPATCWVIPKGARVADEVADARRRFTFDAELVPSITDPDARIVVAHNVRFR